MKLSRGSTLFWASVAVVVAISRWAYLDILWSDEDYHLAVAIQMLHGKMPYRDVWYDKPPLTALAALLFGAWPGWPLRIACILVALGASVFAYRFAARLWTAREGFIAAGLIAFYQIFFYAPGVIPFEPDTLMLLPHLAAVYWAWDKKPALAGFASGIAFLLTPKGAFVLASALVFNPAGWLPMALGFAIPTGVAAIWLAAGGALTDYWTQVWRWGMLYTSARPSEPWTAPLLRVLGWIGFHAALLFGAVRLIRTRSLAAWFAISLAAAALGWRFSPRYFIQILPAACIAAAWGLARIKRSRVALAAAAVALAFPVVRFGPRYLELIGDNVTGRPHTWDDVRLDQESRAAAAIVNQTARAEDTIFIWGYRPNVVVYTRMGVASRYWESQPLTGVPADRHLGESAPLDSEWALRNREDLIRSEPDFIVDGLSAYNPSLDLRLFPELKEWMSSYCQIGSAQLTTVYKRCER